MSRNAGGARLPPREVPRLLPDGSEAKDHGGSFGAYMAYKEQKLAEQFDAGAAAAQRTQLFAGVSIHVNGFTRPSHLELKQLMALHGGRFCNYYHRGTVTHCICSNLPDAKVKQLARERDPTPHVRPEWVVDSIKAARLLPTQDYALFQLRDAPGQQKLLGFAEVRPTALPASAIYGSHAGSVGQEVDAAAAAAAAGAGAVGVGLPALSAAKAQSVQQQQQQQQQQDKQPPAGLLQQQQRQQQQQQDQQPRERSVSRSPRPGSGGRAARAAGRPPGSPGSTAASAEVQEAQQLAARLRAECDMLKGPPKSTKDDPNFAQNYWNSSRLHFIGTWRTRSDALTRSLMESAAAAGAPAPAPHAPGRPRTVIHLDMDCFFAAVAEAEYPIFRGKPLAVCHSASAQGTGEVSTANYAARAFGVRSGMMMGQAKELCPQLIVVPFMFDQYEAVSEKVFRILLRHTSAIQPLSCDEMYLDVTGLGDPGAIAAAIRAEIQAETGCTASAGIGPNLLLARIATEHAKPDGQLAVSQGEAARYLQGLGVDALPGVGWANRSKLAQAGVETVADVLARSKEFLQAELGPKLGAQLWDYAHGRDERRVEPPKPRKSVGAEVNYGVRLASEDAARQLLGTIAADVQQRMQQAGVRGKTITLKIMQRRPGAPEPAKFLGHGICDNHARSVTLARFTGSAEDIAREGWGLLRALGVPAQDIRGMGIQVTKLDNASGSVAGSADAGSHSLAGLWKKQQQQQQQQQQEPDEGGGTGAAAAARSPPGGARRASPSAKQPSLEQVLQQRQAAAAQEDAAAQRRRRLVEQWQGMTLSQMDASVLASLPWDVQRDLIATLPRSRQDQGAAGQQAPAQGQAATAAAAVQPGEQQAQAVAQHEQQQAQQPVEEEEQQQRRQERQSERGEESSDEEAGWEPDSQPEPAAAAAPPHPAGLAAPPMLGGSGSAATPSAAARASVGPGASGSGRPGTPIEALPALSQVDPSVLDALPLGLKRELEMAYGINQPRRLPPALAHGSRGRGTRGGGHGGAAGLGVPRPASKRQRIDSFMAPPPPGTAPGGHAPAAAAAAQQRRGEQLSLSQVDPSVLAELPPELRQEVVRQLQAPGGSRPQQRSRLGQQRDEERAWRQRWQEEQQQRDMEAAGAAAAAQADPALWSQGSLRVASPEQAVWAEPAGAASPLPAPVLRFAELAAAPAPAASLASALADCLEQLLAEGEAEAADDDVSPPRPSSPQPSPGASSGGAASSSSDGGDVDGNSMEADEVDELPPTQPVVLEEGEQLAGTGSPPPAADGSQQQQQQQSPRQDSMQRRHGPGGTPAPPSPGSPGSGLRQGLQALALSLEHAAGSLLAVRDLEQLRLLLLAAQRLCLRHPCFATSGGSAAVEAAQERVARAYGWRLRLTGLLDA